MSQLSNLDRKTVVVRVPRKYEYLIKAFVCWLRSHENQESLWTCENAAQMKYEEIKTSPASRQHIKAMSARMKEIFEYLKLK